MKINKNKFVATGLLISYLMVFMSGFLGVTGIGLTGLSGLGLLVFGIWAIIILYKS